MFKDRKIKYSFGKTINTGNFESTRVDYSEEATVEEGVDMSEARKVLKGIVYEEVAELVAENKPKEEKSRLKTRNPSSDW